MKVTKQTLWLTIAIALPMLLGGGYLLVSKVIKPRYRQYRTASFERSAREFLDRGDFDNAMLFVRKNLAANQQSIPNWRLAVEIAEKRDDPNAGFYLERLLALEPTLANRLRLIRLALRWRDPAAAERAIAGAGAEARDSAEFHELAAQASLRANNPIQAKFHLMTLCGLQPENRAAKLELDQLRLAEAGPDLRDSIRSEIRSLANDPALRVNALVVLLRDTLKHAESRGALELAAQLRREPDLPIPDALVVAETLRQFDTPALDTFLRPLKTRAEKSPAELARVGLFLVSSGRDAEAKAWLATVPADTATQIPVQRVVAAALANLGEWPALEAALKRATWGEQDFDRLALLAFTQRQTGALPAFGETWRLAVDRAADNPAKLELLRQRTVLWGWEEQRIEVLWRLFQHNPADTAVQRQLFAYERARGATANLNRLFSRLLETAPKDPAAKNNYAYTSLLLGHDTARADTLSREALAAEPRNPYYATVRALAHLRAGRPAEARAALATIDALQLWQPERLVVYTAVLVAAGEPAEAEPLLASLDDRGLLPEEKQILADTRAALARARQDSARATRIAETIAENRTTTTGRSILALLSPALRAAPHLPLELADSLYARDEYAQLAQELGAGPWDRHEFLRYALLAYAQRRLERAADARGTWRLAVTTAGAQPDLLRTLADLARAWGWDDERVEVLTRILQRDPTDRAAFDEVVASYERQHRAADLARVYGLRLGAGETDPGLRARFAYFSLLTSSNTSEAHVAAKAAFDQAPADPFAARALALSLWRQGQSRAGIQILGGFATRITPEVDLSLVLALLREADGDAAGARKLLAPPPAEYAFPEEKALAEELARRLAAAG